LKHLRRFNDLPNLFWQLPVVKDIIGWAKVNSLPGFDGVPIFDVVIFVINELKRNDLFTRANSIAFSFFLALFPAIIVLFTLIPFISQYILSNFYHISVEEFINIMELQITSMLPSKENPDGVAEGIGAYLVDTIKLLATQTNYGLLSFGFVLAAFFASNGMISMMRGFEKAHIDGFRDRNIFQTYGTAILLTFFIGFLAIASILFIVIGEKIIFWVGGYTEIEQVRTFGLFLIRWIAVIALVYLGIGLLYRYGAALKRKISIFSAGTTVAAVLSIIASLAFSFYVNTYGSYNRLYGPIGAIMALMLLIQLNALALLIGFELNASIASNLDLKEKLRLQQEKEAAAQSVIAQQSQILEDDSEKGLT